MKKFLICFILILSAVFAAVLAMDGKTYKTQPFIKRYIRLKNTNLKVATYNMGMLSTDFANVPLFKHRENNINSQLTAYLKNENPSVIFLQEVWHVSSNMEIEKAAKRANFVPVIHVKKGKRESLLFENRHGLQILLSSDLLSLATNYTYGFRILKQGESYVCGFGIICRRGYLYARLTIENKVYVFATFHLTPLISETNKRKREAREIIKHLKNENADYIIIGADFNYSPIYGQIHEKDIFNADPQVWETNGNLYIEWIEQWQKTRYTCKDLWQDANPDNAGYTQDRENNSIAAMGNFTRMEPSQRIDQMWMCGKSLNDLEVRKTHLIFTQKIAGKNNYQFELSDHYGVESEIYIYSVLGVYTSSSLCSIGEKICVVYEAKK